MYKKNKFIWPFLAWTILIAGFYIWNCIIFQSHQEESIKTESRAFFEQIQISRQWNAMHNGVYVPITEQTQPNPYLDDPYRDIIIDSLGIALTKVNPAFMTRQIGELAENANGIQFHITSLNPIRPGNKADLWEQNAMEAFEKDEMLEHFELNSIDTISYFRYIKPLYVKSSCMECHAKQGYEIGEIRGAISVSKPAEVYFEAKTAAMFHYTLIYFTIYFIGLIGLFFVRRTYIKFRNKREFQKENLEKANHDLEHELKLRKQYELEIEKNKGKFEAIYKGANDAILLMDDYNFIDCNDATLKLFDCQAEDVIGHNPMEFSPEYQENGEMSIDKISKYIENVGSESYQSFEWTHLTKNKVPIHTLVSLSSIKVGDETLIVSMIKDISIEKSYQDEQRALNLELEKSRDALKERNEELHAQSEKLIKQQDLIEAEKNKASQVSEYKTMFLANMSHEIRTPLNGVIGMLDLLKETRLEGIQQEYVDVIDISSTNLLNVINDILDYTKIEADQLTLEQIPINVHEMATEVVKMLEYKAINKQLQLNLVMDSSMPTSFLGDPVRLKQILINYCNNAINFTEEGGVRIIVSMINESSKNAFLKFEVEDTGIGIAKDKQHLLFKEFTQLDNSISRKYGGTGLGLAISKKISKLMHGEVGVKSELGAGSTFWFTVNLEKTVIKDSKLESVNGVALKGLSILLVEDNLINQQVAIHTLKKNDHIIDIAANGIEAIEKFNQNKYDVILMDIQMPKMNGYDATTAIRKIEKEGHLLSTRIVAMTASVMKGEMEKCKEYGMNDYISKPFKQNDLLSIL